MWLKQDLRINFIISMSHCKKTYYWIWYSQVVDFVVFIAMVDFWGHSYLVFPEINKFQLQMPAVIRKNTSLVKICEKLISLNSWTTGNTLINDSTYKKKLFFDNTVSLFKIKAVKVSFSCCNQMIQSLTFVTSMLGYWGKCWAIWLCYYFK